MRIVIGLTCPICKSLVAWVVVLELHETCVTFHCKGCNEQFALEGKIQHKQSTDEDMQVW